MEAILNDPVALWASVALLIAVPLGLWSVLRVEARIRASVRNTSRFELFAVRDDLVSLVLDGKISEDNPVWRTAYQSTCGSLRLDSKRALLRELIRQMRFEFKAASDPALKKSVRGFAKKVEKTCKKVPELRPVLQRMVWADMSMLAQRSGKRRIQGFLLALRCLLLTWILITNGRRIVSESLRFTKRSKVSLKLFRAINPPYAGSLRSA